MTVRDVALALRAHWILASALFLLTVVASGAATLAMTPQYQSEAQVFVTATGGNDPNAAYQGDLFAQQRIQSYAVIARGDLIAAQVVEQLGLSITPRALAAQISISIPPSTSLLNISVVDPSAVRAQQIAEAVTRLFQSTVTSYEQPSADAQGRVRLIVTQPASLPTAPISPSRVLNLGLGVLLGLLLGVGGAVVRYMPSDARRSQLKAKSRNQQGAGGGWGDVAA